MIGFNSRLLFTPIAAWSHIIAIIAVLFSLKNAISGNIPINNVNLGN